MLLTIATKIVQWQLWDDGDAAARRNVTVTDMAIQFVNI